MYPCKLLFLCIQQKQIIWSRLYSAQSSTDRGTLHQLRNLINHVNMGRKELKHQVNEVENFFELVVICHLISAVMHFFGIKSVIDTPSINGFSDLVNQLPLHHRKLFFDRMEKIIDEYVVPKQISSPREPTVPDTGSSTNPHIPQIHQEHCYGHSTARAIQYRHLPSSISSVSRQTPVSQPVRRTAPDGVFDYTSAVVKDGLLLLEFNDAIREGDGTRIL